MKPTMHQALIADLKMQTFLLDSGVSEISQMQSPKLQLHSIKLLLEAKGSNFLGKVSLPQL